MKLNHLLIGCAFVAMVLIASALSAQVRNEPAGNSLPQEHGHDHSADSLQSLLSSPRSKLTPQEHMRFAEQVDLKNFRKLAVFDGGRAKILDTMAREHLTHIYGKPRWKDAATDHAYDPLFTYLDLIFNKAYYHDKPMIYVEVLPLRESLVAHLPPAEQEAWKKRGRFAPVMFADPRVADQVSNLQANLTLFKAIAQVRSSFNGYLAANENELALVSPPLDSDHWAHLHELNSVRVAGVVPASNMATLADGQVATAVLEQFKLLRAAWQRTDAVAVNAALAQLTELIPQLNPHSYPTPWVRGTEYFYNATHKFTVGYVVYFFAAIALLVAFGARRLWLIRAGIAFMIVGFVIHTAGIVVRGVLAERVWAIHNQYESFIAISWFAVLGGLILMFVKRQWLFGAAASALGCCTLLFANTVPIPSAEIGRVAAILDTSRILYVHVNMVLFSYGLIGLGFFISLFYLAHYYIENRTTAKLMAAGLGTADFSVQALDNPAATGRQRLLSDLDHAQMVVLQLAFWILGVGVLLGAYWADHAWGRWWAWDPKETWALITWIIYLMVIHLRLVVKRRGLVTAWMSVVGFIVMLWTYWGVNLLLAGLHSYA